MTKKRKRLLKTMVRYEKNETKVGENILYAVNDQESSKRNQTIKDDAIDTTAEHNQTTYQNKHGNYPKWMSRKKVDKLKKVRQKKKVNKKLSQKKKRL